MICSQNTNLINVSSNPSLHAMNMTAKEYIYVKHCSVYLAIDIQSINLIEHGQIEPSPLYPGRLEL